MLKIVETSTRGTNSMPFLVLRRGSFVVYIGIICGSGSFAVQFGDHLRSGDHLWSGIICGAVQFFETKSFRLCFCKVSVVPPFSFPVHLQLLKCMSLAFRKFCNSGHTYERRTFIVFHLHEYSPEPRLDALK